MISIPQQTPPLQSLGIVAAGPEWMAKSETVSLALQQKLNLFAEKQVYSNFQVQWVKSTPVSACDFILEVGESLRLRNREGLVFLIDFDQDHIHYRQKQVGKKHPLARALGIEKGCKRVVDLSCGLARDSVLLAQIGFEVQAFERSPILAMIIQDAQERSERPEVKKIQFANQDSLQALRQMSALDLAEKSFYFDPMFPETKKDALPKKEMQIFRDLIGADADAEEVMRLALQLQVTRIVVKRPRRAPPLFTKPRYSLEGNLIRFDVYYF